MVVAVVVVLVVLLGSSLGDPESLDVPVLRPVQMQSARQHRYSSNEYCTHNNATAAAQETS